MSTSGTSRSSGESTEVMDQRKRKRMLSNRESARRSRQRKQKQLDDLTAEVSQLRKENAQVVAALKVTTQHYLGVEAENSVLRTQMVELSHRLQSLNEILSCMSTSEASDELFCDDDRMTMMMMMKMKMMMMRQQHQQQQQQPIMASVDTYQYC